MDDPMKAIMALIGLGFMAWVAGAAFMAGMAITCRWLKWAPVNLTVTLNDYRDDQ